MESGREMGTPGVAPVHPTLRACRMNPVAWVLDALKVWPETVQLPEALHEATPQQLAEARSRLQQIGQVANELRKLIDEELAGVLQGGAMRYGDTILRPSDRGASKVKDEDRWWEVVVTGLQASPRPVELLAALYPASSVRLTALPKLAAALGEDDLGVFKRAHIEYASATSPLSAMPLSKAPKWAQALEEGQLSNARPPRSEEEIRATVERKIDEARDRAVAILRDEIEEGKLQ